jgi:hypothetical protein
MDPHAFGLLQRVQAEQDATRRAEMMEESGPELGAHFARHNSDLEELAWDLYNITWRDVQGGYWSTPGAEDIVSSLIEVKTVGKGDSDFIEEDVRGMRAYFQGKGGQIRSDIIRAERQQMPREELVTAIDIHADEIELNFWGTLGNLQTQAAEKVRTAPAQKLVDLVIAAVQSGSTYLTAAASTLSDTQVDPVLGAVADKSGGMATIFGTLSAIRKFANVGLDFGFAIQQNIFQSGTIAQYKGYPVVQMSNWEDFEGRFVLSNSELYIIGKNAGRLTWFGPQAKSQVLQLPSFYRRFESARDVGISIFGAPKGRVGRIVLT